MIIKIDHTDVDHPLYAEPMTKLYNSIFGEMQVGSPAYYHPIVADGTLIWGMNTIELDELDDLDVVYIELDDKVLFLLIGYEIAVQVQNA